MFCEHRILGCTHRHNMEKLKAAYNKQIFKKSIDEILKSNMKGHFLLACQALLSNDMSMSPTGSFREPWQVCNYFYFVFVLSFALMGACLELSYTALIMIVICTGFTRHCKGRKSCYG